MSGDRIRQVQWFLCPLYRFLQLLYLLSLYFIKFCLPCFLQRDPQIALKLVIRGRLVFVFHLVSQLRSFDVGLRGVLKDPVHRAAIVHV